MKNAPKKTHSPTFVRFLLTTICLVAGLALLGLHRPASAQGPAPQETAPSAPAGPINPDVTGDTRTDVLDLQTVAAAWGTTPPDPGWDPDLDLNGDGIIDAADLDLVANRWHVGLATMRSSPTDGEGDVAVTRETILHFSQPISATTVTSATVQASFGGQPLSGWRHVSADGTSVTLFYDDPLPASARVRVTVDGDALADAEGYAVDPDGDGLAGGVATIDFDTLSLTVVPGTSVCGRVFASELAPGGGGGSVNTPLEGATITVDGMEATLNATTDDLGNFCLDPSPAGRFFVHVDGRTAVGVPEGDYYPFVGKPWTSVPGEQLNVGDVFLPRVISGTLQPVSEITDTVIAFPQGVLDEYPDFAGTEITVPAGSLFNDDGTPGGNVGLAPVPPDRLPGQLPPTLDLPLVITVQTDGATNFDVPAPVCFPNLPDPGTGETLPPGAKSSLVSFNHDTGRWQVVGPMTVDDSGDLVCTDPGVGIPAPGWHGSWDGVTIEDDLGPPHAEQLEACPAPEDFYEHWYECTYGAGTGVGGWMPWPGASDAVCTVNDLGWVMDARCQFLPEEMHQEAPATVSQGYACMAQLQQCLDDPPPQGEWTADLLADLDQIELLSTGILSDVATHADLQTQILDIIGDAMSDDELTDDELAQVQPIIEQLDALVANQNPAGYYTDRLDDVADLAEGIDEALTLLDFPPGYYLLHNVDAGNELRGRTLQGGRVQLPMIQAETNYVLYRLAPSSLTVSRLEFLTGGPGTTMRLPYAGWVEDTSPDSDGEGLSDTAEWIVGTDPDNADTDGDGVSDYAEVLQDTDPLDGLPAATGIIASADTPGTAVDVCARNDAVVVADSEAGISVFNVFNGMDPVTVAQVDTPGAAQRAACAGNRVVVADGYGGLLVVDVSDPPAANIAQQIGLGGSVQAVAVAGETAYAGTNTGRVAAVDVNTGTVLDDLYVNGGVRDVGLLGDTLYVLTPYDLVAVDLSVSPFTVGSVVASPYPAGSNSRLFVGSAVAYAVHGRGYNTFDLSDPAQPTLIAAGDTSQFGWKQIVANGSGLGVAAVGTAQTLDDPPHNVSLYDVSDPAQTNAFLAEFETPGVARAVSIYNGLAYVADHENGMQVVNYISYDTQNTPPAIELGTNYPAGIAEEGQELRLTAVVSDDVQVRNVEFYVDGERVATDGNFPFNYRFVTPLISEQPTLTVQARASDTGYNVAWSAALTLTLVPDATAPQVVRVTPKDGSVNAVDTVNAVSAAFNEPMDPATLTTDTVRLYADGADGTPGTGDDVPITGTISYQGDNRTVFLTPDDPLPVDTYRAVVTSTETLTITDLAGNGLDAGRAWTFHVREPITWTDPAGGLWTDPANWSSGTVPGADDIAHITLSGDYTVTLRGNRTVGQLILDGGATQPTLWIQGGSGNAILTVQSDFANAGTVRLETAGGSWESELHVADGTLTNLGAIEVNAGTGGNRYLGANLANQGSLVVNDDLNVNKTGARLTNEGNVTVAPGRVLNVNGSAATFNQNGGQIAGPGAFEVRNSSTLNVNGGTITNTSPLVQNAALTLGPGATGPVTFRLARNSQLSGDVPAGVELWIAGGSGGGNATTTALQGFTNHGTIRLQTTSGGWNSNLAVPGGTLANMGVIAINPGTGGTRRLSANVDNQGVIDVNDTVVFDRNNGLVTQAGTIDVADGHALVLDGGSGSVEQFVQNGGTITGTGTLDLRDGTYVVNGGAIAGTSPILRNTDLSFAPGVTETVSYQMAGPNGTLSGDVPAGALVWIAGGLTASNATATAATGFSNQGTVRLQTVGGSWNSSLIVSSGTLTNTGTIEVNPGTGGARTLDANLDNRNLLDLNRNLTMSDNAITNTGTITIESGDLYEVIGGSFAFNGGTITGPDPHLRNVTLRFGLANTGTATFRLGGTGNQLEGDVPAGVLVWIAGGLSGSNAKATAPTGFVNAGTIRLEAVGGGFDSSLVVSSGTLTNTGTIDVNAGTGGNRFLSGSLYNQAQMNVNDSLTFDQSGATYDNAGTIAVAGGHTLQVTAGTLTNAAGGTLAGPGTFEIRNSSTLNVNGGVITNTSPLVRNAALTLGPGATGPVTFRLARNSQLSGDVPAGVELWIAGGIGGGNATTTAQPFTNHGIIRLETASGSWDSSLAISSGTLTNTGTIQSTAGTGGSRRLTAHVVNQGTMDVAYDVTLVKANGVLTHTGTIDVASGRVLALNGGSGSDERFVQNGGLITGTGTLVLYRGSYTVNGGSVGGTSPILRNSALSFGPAVTETVSYRMAGPDGVLTGDVPAGALVWIAGGLIASNSTATAPASLVTAGTIRLQTVGGSWNSSLVVGSGTLTNTGTLEVNAGTGGARTLDAALVNQGVLDVGSGETLDVDTGPVTNADGGTIQGLGTLDVSGLTVSNGGILSPGASPGILTIQGPLPQTTTAVLDVEIGGLTAGTDYDRLAVSGAATLTGTLNITLTNGYEPNIGDTFTIMTFGSGSGQFATVNGLVIGNGKRFEVQYNAGDVTLEVVLDSHLRE